MTVELTAGAMYGLLLLVGGVLGMAAWRRVRRGPDPWVRRSRRVVQRSLSGIDAVLLGTVLLSMLLLTGLVLLAMGAEDGEITPRVVMVQSVGVHWTILLTVVILLRARRMSWARVFGLHRSRLGGDLRRGVVAYLIMLPVVFLYSVVYRLVLQSLGMELEMQDVARVLTGEASLGARVYLLFLGIVLGPLTEEVLFRGVLFPVVARKLGALGSMVLVSVLFAAIHVHVPSLVPLFVLSMSLCIGYVYVGSIVAPVVMHMLFNAVNLGLAFLVQNA